MSNHQKHFTASCSNFLDPLGATDPHEDVEQYSVDKQYYL